MAIFSLHPTKAITSGEGGIVTTRDPALAERLAVFRHHGMVRDPERFVHPEGAGDEGPWYHEQQHLGFNYRLTDVHAALGHSQLGKLDDHVAAPQRHRRPLPRGAGRDRRARSCRRPRRRARCTPTTSSSSTCRGGTARAARALRAARRERHPRPGPLHPRLPPPLLPQRLRLRRRGSAPRPSATTRAASRSPATPTSPPADQDRVVEVCARSWPMAEQAPCRRASRSAAARSATGHPTYVIAEAGANHNRDLGDGARADRRRRRGRRRRGQVPDLHRARTSTRRRRPASSTSRRSSDRPQELLDDDRAAARVAARAARPRRRARDRLLLQPLRRRGRRPSSTRSACRR